MITPIYCEAVLKPKRFRVVKPEIRVLGVDDGKFVPHVKGHVLVVGVVFRGGYWLDGVLHTRVEVDGFDATDKIAAMITRSSHCKQLRVVMLNGITVAGFNVVDLKALNEATNLPIITVTRDKPNLDEIREALHNLPESERRWKLILDAGEPFELSTRNEQEKIYVQTVGISVKDAEKIVRLTSTRSSIPEPLRVAHLIASGIGGA
ncbi:MAG: DUF99 family protein [Candidatus Bathyarchaeota archaeon]|nr:DUF99 family protein [Candidatus Bathyarchaeota archaeon]